MLGSSICKKVLKVDRGSGFARSFETMAFFWSMERVVRSSLLGMFFFRRFGREEIRSGCATYINIANRDTATHFEGFVIDVPGEKD